MKKKILTTFLAAVMAVSMAACSSKTDAPAETPAETTADPTEAPAAEETDEQAAEAGSAIVIGENSFTSLEEAFAAVPDCEDMINGEPTYVKLKGTIEVNNTINVPEKKNIMLVAAEDNTTIKRAAGFTESMFTVNGGNLQMAGGSVTDSDGNAIGSGSLTVDGTGDGVTGSIVEVASGNYALIDGTTLTGNTTAGNGGAINNAAGANVYLLGGTITANSAAAGGAIYSEGTVNIRGTVSVTGNTVTNSFEAASNLVLAKDGVINVSGAVTGSVIGVAVQEAKAGKTVVKLGDTVADVTLADPTEETTTFVMPEHDTEISAVYKKVAADIRVTPEELAFHVTEERTGNRKSPSIVTEVRPPFLCSYR